jgi:hypothetical protein
VWNRGERGGLASRAAAWLVLVTSLLSACGGEDAAPGPSASATPSATSVVATATHTPSAPPDTPTGTPTATATSTGTDPVAARLSDALEPLCLQIGIVSSYSLTGRFDDFAMNCVPSAGHQTTASIHGFPGADDASAAFQNTLAQNPCLASGEYRGLPAAMCELPFGLGGLLATWIWRDGCWLVRVAASDDTDFLLAPEPFAVSNAIFDTAAEIGLFSTCPARAELAPTVVDAGVDYSDCRGPFARLSICVENTGPGIAGPFVAAVGGDMYAFDDGLQPGMGLCVQGPFHGGEVTVVVDPDDRIPEIDETNNTLTQPVREPTVPATCAPASPTPTG